MLADFEKAVLATDAHFHQLTSESEVGELVREIWGSEWDGKGEGKWGIPEAEERTLGVVEADFGVVETGSVGLVETSREQMLHSLLSQELLVLVYAEDLVKTLPEAALLLREAFASGEPSQITLLSGPSRTGDIELRHVSGIQGPYEVHVALCNFPKSARISL